MKSLHAMYGLPDSLSLNGMFLRKSTKWVLQDKTEPEEEDVFIASVGSFQTPPLFRYHKGEPVKNDWAYLWEVEMSRQIGFRVYLTEAGHETYVVGVRGRPDEPRTT